MMLSTRTLRKAFRAVSSSNPRILEMPFPGSWYCGTLSFHSFHCFQSSPVEPTPKKYLIRLQKTRGSWPALRPTVFVSFCLLFCEHTLRLLSIFLPVVPHPAVCGPRTIVCSTYNQHPRPVPTVPVFQEGHLLHKQHLQNCSLSLWRTFFFPCAAGAVVSATFFFNAARFPSSYVQHVFMLFCM